MLHPELDEKFIAKQKRLLIAEKKRLEAELLKIADKRGGKFHAKWEQVGDDEDDNAQETDQFSKNVEIEGDLESLLQNVNSALKRIEENTYGIDIVDNTPIPKERLEVFPSATMKIENEEKIEQTVKRYFRKKNIGI